MNTSTKKRTILSSNSKKIAFSSFDEFEKKMNLPDCNISEEEIMKEVKAVRHEKRKH
jgi:hypothetical protein